MKTFITTAFLASALTFISVTVFAQAPPPSSNPLGAPLDVVASLLLLGGAAYGSKRIGRAKSSK